MGHDALVIGGGLVGLSCATAIAARGGRVLVLDTALPGQASAAGAGMLAPSIEGLTSAAAPFAVAARDRFPSHVAMLRERTGLAVPLNREGIIELRTVGDPRPPAARLDATALAALEPPLVGAGGAVLHPLDGAVDNVALLDALRALAAVEERVETERVSVVRVEIGREAAVAHLADGDRRSADAIVLAAGAWTAQIGGLPRPVPIEPVRGQMISLGFDALRHVVVGPEGYLVPRGDRVLVGATMEWVGFDPATSPGTRATLRQLAVQLCPALRSAQVIEHWAGLRPVTPDLLPILGADPEWPRLIYACGHSRNGILMAPLTGECIAAVVTGAEPDHDLAPFSIDRFAAG